MEFLKGIPGSKPEQIVDSGGDLNDFSKTAANVFLKMIFRDGFYHADPHLGNFMLLEGGAEGLTDVLLEIGSPPEDIARIAFRSDVSALLIEYGTQSLT